MKKNILTTIVYHYYLAKAQCSSIKPLFINKFNNRSNIIWMGSIKSIRCCWGLKANGTKTYVKNVIY